MPKKLVTITNFLFLFLLSRELSVDFAAFLMVVFYKMFKKDICFLCNRKSINTGENGLTLQLFDDKH